MFNNIFFNRSLLVRSAGLLAIGAATTFATLPASAADEDLHKIVKFQDLDLSTTAGTEALYARLRVASRNVCASLDSRDLRLTMKYNACVDTALDAAIRQVNDRRLTSLHEQVTVASSRSLGRAGA